MNHNHKHTYTQRDKDTQNGKIKSGKVMTILITKNRIFIEFYSRSC